MVFEINDGLDSIQFPDYVKRMVDTAEFRRLASVRQLGLASLVFPFATHQRNAHSLGVAKNGVRMLK